MNKYLAEYAVLQEPAHTSRLALAAFLIARILLPDFFQKLDACRQYQLLSRFKQILLQAADPFKMYQSLCDLMLREKQINFSRQGSFITMDLREYSQRLTCKQQTTAIRSTGQAVIIFDALADAVLQ